MATEIIKQFDAINFIYKILVFVGLWRLKNPKYKMLGYLHYLYRNLIFFWLLLRFMQEVLFIAQGFSNKDKIIDCLLIALPSLNFLSKLVTIKWHYKKLEQINELINDPIFAANNEADRKLLRGHHDILCKFTKQIIFSVLVLCALYVLSTVINRMNDDTYTVPLYMPFNTNTSSGFLLSMIPTHGPILHMGVGHIMLDVLIVSYFYQATMQIKLIKQNLERLTDSENLPGYYGPKHHRVYRYIDVLDETIKERFQYYVKRYAKLLWFTKEVNDIFNNPISIQMFTTSAMLCLDIHLISKGFEEISHTTFYVLYFFIVQSQVFMYCYCGELVKYESGSVGESVYQCDWYNLSPRFRKQILIAMTRWTYAIAPNVSCVISLSLTTYITIMRAAFNLFAVLKTTNRLQQ